MKTVFKGEVIYTAEVDAHFPQLSVGDTLYFAAMARSPRQIPGGETRERYAEHLRDVRPHHSEPIHRTLICILGCHGHVRYQSYHQHKGWRRFRERSQRW
jgi:hypothetical protein